MVNLARHLFPSRVQAEVSSLTPITLQIALGPDRPELVQVDLVRGPPVQLQIHGHHLGPMSFKGDDVFDALVAMRLRLEQDGYRLLCNAARKDAYPSRMSREMSGGRKVYIFKAGRQALREDLIDVFDPATYDEVGTVSEQRSNYEAWIRSLV
jgi:hypothetical protein